MVKILKMQYLKNIILFIQKNYSGVEIDVKYIHTDVLKF